MNNDDQRIKEGPLTVSPESELALPQAHDTTVDPAAEVPVDEDFDLDIRFVKSGQVAEELLRPTDDGCGHTCESACPQTCQ